MTPPALPAPPTNAVTSYTLNAGEFIQWEPSGEMSGSVLSADKPVGVCVWLWARDARLCDGLARVVAFLGAGLVLLAAGTRYARLVAEAEQPPSG